MTEYAGTVDFAQATKFVHVHTREHTAYSKYYHFYTTLSLTSKKNN